MSKKILKTVWRLLTPVALLSLLLSACGSAPAPKVYRVGILSGLDFFAPAVDGFKSKMEELGYVEGQNISYDAQATNVDPEAYKRIAKKFVEDKVDLIFVFPTEATMAAKVAAQDSNIPVVFALSFVDVAGVNLINSIREPGGNITGARYPSADVASKRLEILLDIAPNAKRIFVPYLKGYPSVPSQMDVIRSQAKTLGVELIEFAASSPQELETEMDRLVAADNLGLDAILMISEPLSATLSFYEVLKKFAYKHRIPFGGNDIEEDGVIFGFTPNAKKSGEQAAILTDKVFKGAPAGTIPVVSPESELTLNFKAAQALGVTIPDILLKQAVKVIR